MSFLFVFVYDMAASGIGIISAVCVGMIFFKRMLVVRKGSGLKKLLLVVLCGTCMAALGALLYTTGLLRNGFTKALAPYITLAGEAVCISLIFEERLRACWGIVVFNGVVTDFAQAVSFAMSSRESFHMRIAEERIEYMARSMIAGPAVFILLLFILHKMEAGKAYSQWMEHEDTWKWGMICLSFYPVLTTGITVWFMNSGMRIGGSWMLSFIMLLGILLIFNYAGHTEEQQKELLLNLGITMNICMDGFIMVGTAIAEEKEKHTLRVLMTSSVTGGQYFAGSIIFPFVILIIINYFVLFMSGVPSEQVPVSAFFFINVVVSFISCVLGMIVGICAKNQMNANLISYPLMVVFMIVPIFGNMSEGLHKLSGFLFTGVMTGMTECLANGEQYVIKPLDISVLFGELVISVLVFLMLYKKNGYERD